MFKHYIWLIVSVLILSSCQQEPSLQRASDGINARPALWKVSKNGHTMYIFGSIHILPPEVKWYTSKIQKAYEASEVLIVESLSETDKDKVMLLQKKYGFLPQGKVISMYLNDKEYQTYKTIVAQVGMDRYYADRMKPWLFFISLTNRFVYEVSKYGVDVLMIKEARKMMKKTIALETSKDAIKSLAAIPLKEDIKRLKKFLNQKPVDKKNNNRKDANNKQVDMFVAWIIGDTQRLARILRTSMPSKDYYNIITKRNNKWYPKIKSYIKRYKTAFLTVGTGHLVGKNSIIKRLKRDGYKVDRIQ